MKDENLDIIANWVSMFGGEKIRLTQELFEETSDVSPDFIERFNKCCALYELPWKYSGVLTDKEFSEELPISDFGPQLRAFFLKSDNAISTHEAAKQVFGAFRSYARFDDQENLYLDEEGIEKLPFLKKAQMGLYAWYAYVICEAEFSGYDITKEAPALESNGRNLHDAYRKAFHSRNELQEKAKKDPKSAKYEVKKSIKENRRSLLHVTTVKKWGITQTILFVSTVGIFILAYDHFFLKNRLDPIPSHEIIQQVVLDAFSENNERSLKADWPTYQVDGFSVENIRRDDDGFVSDLVFTITAKNTQFVRMSNAEYREHRINRQCEDQDSKRLRDICAREAQFTLGNMDNGNHILQNAITQSCKIFFEQPSWDWVTLRNCRVSENLPQQREVDIAFFGRDKISEQGGVFGVLNRLIGRRDVRYYMKIRFDGENRLPLEQFFHSRDHYNARWR